MFNRMYHCISEFSEHLIECIIACIFYTSHIKWWITNEWELDWNFRLKQGIYYTSLLVIYKFNRLFVLFPISHTQTHTHTCAPQAVGRTVFNTLSFVGPNPPINRKLPLTDKRYHFKDVHSLQQSCWLMEAVELGEHEWMSEAWHG